MKFGINREENINDFRRRIRSITGHSESKKKGYRVIAASIYLHDVGISLADFPLNISTFDIDGNLEITDMNQNENEPLQSSWRQKLLTM